MSTVQTIVGAIVAAALIVLLFRQFQRQHAKRADQGRVLFEPVFRLLEKPDLQRGVTAGVWMLQGRYRDYPFQFKTIADTLATRKLPSLWLMVTLPVPQPVSTTTDLMMRAQGLSSFSNFDFLPHTLALPHGFPEQATVRSDVATPDNVLPLLSPHLDLFHNGRGKEFLISPKGLRIVVQLAEGDKARYGVFREANFDATSVHPALAQQLMNILLDLQSDIQKHATP